MIASPSLYLSFLRPARAVRGGLCLPPLRAGRVTAGSRDSIAVTATSPLWSLSARKKIPSSHSNSAMDIVDAAEGLAPRPNLPPEGRATERFILTVTSLDFSFMSAC